jgi:hypothetical protein
MQNEQPPRSRAAKVDGAASAVGTGDGRPRLSRRQAMGRMSAVASAGAVAWVVPEILTAKPAAGAALSNPVGGSGSVGVSTSASSGGDPGTGASVAAGGTVSTDGPDGVATAADTAAANPPSSLAFTGLDITRDAEVGAAMVAGGWAMQHWASRTPKRATAGPSDGPAAEGRVGGA